MSVQCEVDILTLPFSPCPWKLIQTNELHSQVEHLVWQRISSCDQIIGIPFLFNCVTLDSRHNSTEQILLLYSIINCICLFILCIFTHTQIQL